MGERTPNAVPPQADILVAEDDAINLYVIENMLRLIGHGIVAARDGEEAVDLTLRTAPRLVLMDISMPKLDGVEALRRIRDRMPAEHIPIVAVTANATATQREACAAAGFDGFLTKPLDSGELRRIIDEFLPARA